MKKLIRYLLSTGCFVWIVCGQWLLAAPDTLTVPDLNITTTQGAPVTFGVLPDDADDYTLIELGSPEHGTATDNADGTVTYSPDTEFSGTDSFTYTLRTGKPGKPKGKGKDEERDKKHYGTGTITVTVLSANAPPVAADDGASTDEDAPVTIAVLDNDSDPNGDPLTLESITQGEHGSSAINPDGTVTYTPNTDYNGSDSFDYTISDGHGGTASAQVTVTITPVNDAPIADDQAISTDEDTEVSITLTASDVDSDSFDFQILSGPAHGQLSGTAPDLTYTPDADYSGPDNFTFQVNDGSLTDEGTVSITVGATNDPPVAVDDAVTTDEDAPVTIAILDNDSDSDGDDLSVAGITDGTNGTTTSNPDGTVTYTPNADYHGTDSFEYTISDGNGGTADGTVAVTVNPVNDNPVANDDQGSTPEDTPVELDVLANDSDVDDDDLSVQNVTQANGVVRINPDGTLTYDPTPNFSGTDTFMYTVVDGNGGKATATVTLFVGAVNDPPLAVDDAATTDEDVPVTIAVLDNDSDPDFDELTLEDATPGDHGSTAINPDGTVTYSPNANYHGSDSFTYTISDGNGSSASGQVTVTIKAVNDAPIADDQSISTDEDTKVSFRLAASDVDGDPLTFQVLSGPTYGQLSGTAPDLTYTPDANYNGPDNFTFQVSDGDLTDEGNVTISVGAANDPPVAVDDAAVTDEDTPVTIAVLDNDSDPEDDDLSVENVISQGVIGTVTVNTDGTITYAPAPNYNGSDSFGYTISDGNGGFASATVSITIAPVNDDPLANDDQGTTLEDTPVVLDVLANDFDVDGDELTIQNVTQANGVVHINPDGTLTYDPTPNFSGTDTFDYTIIDGNGGRGTATVLLTVESVNDPPLAVDDAVATDEDVPVTIAVLDNDSDPDDDDLDLEEATQGEHGTTDINPGGTITYTPNPDYYGSDSFEYTISDGNGGFASAAVSITIAPVNDAPIADDLAAVTEEDSELDITLTGSDIDSPPPLDFQVLSGPTHGQLSGSAPDLTYTPDADYHGPDNFTFQVSDGDLTDDGTVTLTITAANDLPIAVDDAAATDEDVPVTIAVLVNDSDPDYDDLILEEATQGEHGTTDINPEGTITYTPAADFYGSDSFEYAISDGNGGTSSATVTLTVRAVNDAPVADDQSISTEEDTPVALTLTGSDIDSPPPLDFQVLSEPTHGQLSGTAPDLTYTPDADYHGPDNFTFQVSDGDLTDEGTVTLTITAANDPPVAVDNAAATDEDIPVTIAVLDNDSDPDNDDLTLEEATQGEHGTTDINPDSTITYSPAADFYGSDSFEYTISDGNGGTASATVTLTVRAVNDAPVAQNDSYTGTEDIPLSVSAPGVLANDSDVDQEPLSAALASPPASGELELHADGSFDYTPADGFNGTVTFQYQAVDEDQAMSNVATVTLAIGAVNDPPIADALSVTTDEDQSIDFTLTGSDPEDDPLTFTVDENPSHGALSGTPPDLTYLPAPDYYGPDAFTFTADDGHGGSASATVSLTVQAVNDAPVAQNDNYSGTEDIPLTVNAPGVLANDSDVDQEILSAALASPPTSGELDLRADGSFTYTPEPGFNGTVTFQYRALDEAQAESNVATVTLAIGAVNDPPIAARDEAFTESNTSVTIDVLLNDTDPDGDALTVVGTTTPVHGSVLINPGGTLTYTPDVDFSGSDGFSYEISDGMGGLASAQVVVFVNISGITEGMSVGSEGGTVTSDAGALIDIPAGALDSDVEIQIGEFTDPPAGADVAGPMFFFGPSGTQFSVEVTITVPYDPELVPEGFDESELVLLLYNEYDGTWEALPSSVNTIAHTITGVTTHFSGFVAGIAPNHAPVVLQSLPNKSIEEDTPYATLIPSLTEYFFDQDEGDQLTFSATALEDGLDTLLIGQYLDLIAIPSENFFGKVHIVVLATDRRALFASDTLLLTVAPVNDAPQFVAIIPDFHIYEDHAAPPIPLWAEDVEGDQLTYSAISDTVAVAVTITDTILHAVPAPNWHGSARILVSVSDGQATQVDTFNLTVEALNDAPSAFDLFEPADASVIYIQPENIGDSLTFAWDDALDPDGDPVTYTFTLLDSNTVQWEYAGLTSHEVKVSYADIVAAIRDQDLMLATFWWTIVAISGQDTVQAAQGPFQLTIDTGTLAVADQGALPQFFVMHQNYPNPFNPITTLKYELPAHSRVLLVIYDMRGREVTRLVDGYVPAGYNKVVWNSSDAAGRPVPSGVYFARLVTSEYTHTIKMTLVR